MNKLIRVLFVNNPSSVFDILIVINKKITSVMYGEQQSTFDNVLDGISEDIYAHN